MFNIPPSSRVFPEMIAVDVPAPIYDSKSPKIIDWDANFVSVEFITMIKKIDEDVKYAMKNKNTVKLQVLRSLKSEIKNAEIRKGTLGNPLQESEIIAIIRKQVKQREDSIEQFLKGGRHDLALKEDIEKGLLNNYLPVPLTDLELDGLVDLAIRNTEATSKKDMGKVIKLATEICNGRADGKTLSTLISKKLQ